MKVTEVGYSETKKEAGEKRFSSISRTVKVKAEVLNLQPRIVLEKLKEFVKQELK